MNGNSHLLDLYPKNLKYFILFFFNCSDSYIITYDIFSLRSSKNEILDKNKVFPSVGSELQRQL